MGSTGFTASAVTLEGMFTGLPLDLFILERYNVKFIILSL
jgi:hypothetical protein